MLCTVRVHHPLTNSLTINIKNNLNLLAADRELINWCVLDCFCLSTVQLSILFQLLVQYPGFPPSNCVWESQELAKQKSCFGREHLLHISLTY